MYQKNVNLNFHIILFYKSMILVITCFIFISSSPGNVWGADVYIDPTYSGMELGTFKNPYNSWNDIVSFSAPDDYRQKCGTTYTGELTITTAGASNNHIIIGAYYDNGGTPVHEDSDPSFGKFCGNSAQKPIIKNTIGSGTLIHSDMSSDSQYLEIHSIQLKDADEGVEFSSRHNWIRYCYLFNLNWGIRVGLPSGYKSGSYNTIEYNYIDLNETENNGKTNDAIQLGPRATNNIIQYNHITEFEHGAVQIFGGDNNIIQYNYVYAGDNRIEDFCIGFNASADSNVIRYNYCKNSGMAVQLMGGDNNEIYGNVLTCNGGVHPKSNQGCVQIQSDVNLISNIGNKIYNNTVYDSNGLGIHFYADSSDTGQIYINEVHNNLILKTKNELGGYCIKVFDSQNLIASNTFYNNSCYDYNTHEYAMIEGSKYTSASSFDARVDAANNRDDNPGLKNPALGQFWPDDLNDNVVGNGYNLGLNYNQVLDPDATDFTVSPPLVKTKAQPFDWFIGAYALPGRRPAVNPPTDLAITPIEP